MNMLLPEQILCRGCGEALTLEEQERKEGKYVCPLCKNSFDLGKGEMICPNCRAEYVTGILECSDCRIPLVQYLLPEPDEEVPDYVEILSTYNAADIAVVKSLLKGENIVYRFSGEHFNQIEPMVQPARLLVREDHVEEAMNLLKEVSIQFTTVHPQDQKKE